MFPAKVVVTPVKVTVVVPAAVCVLERATIPSPPVITVTVTSVGTGGALSRETPTVDCKSLPTVGLKITTFGASTVARTVWNVVGVENPAGVVNEIVDTPELIG